MVEKCSVKFDESNESITDDQKSNPQINTVNNHNNQDVAPIKNEIEKNKIKFYVWLKNNPDLNSIILLIALYIIQGLPFGLSTAIPVIYL